MSYSYLNNGHIKFNNNSCWFTNDRPTYRQFIVIELLLRELIAKKLIKNKDFYMFDISIDLRTKSQVLSLIMNFKYQLSYRKFKNEEIIEQVMSWISPIKNRFKIEKISLKPTMSNGDKSAFCFAQVLAREMAKYISNKKIRMLAKAHISHKSLGYIIKLGGRINGNGIARHDKIQQGLISRNTLKYDIEFAKFISIGKSGCVGIKVWLNRGLLPTRDQVMKEITNSE